ncbi:MAG: hypothetical protein Ct9H300mP8_06700 [Gammaproteobacteria bacterium]|nr:MAG: hypothetical protein Ct9H300mP8_06700 [Gammaproteobacteria bacterium]
MPRNPYIDSSGTGRNWFLFPSKRYWGNCLFSGQIGLDPATMDLVSHTFEAEILQVFRNLASGVPASGVPWVLSLKRPFFFSQISSYLKGVNKVFTEQFTDRSQLAQWVWVSKLPRAHA